MPRKDLEGSKSIRKLYAGRSYASRRRSDGRRGKKLSGENRRGAGSLRRREKLRLRELRSSGEGKLKPKQRKRRKTKRKL